MLFRLLYFRVSRDQSPWIEGKQLLVVELHNLRRSELQTFFNMCQGSESKDMAGDRSIFLVLGFYC